MTSPIDPMRTIAEGPDVDFNGPEIYYRGWFLALFNNKSTHRSVYWSGNAETCWLCFVDWRFLAASASLGQKLGKSDSLRLVICQDRIVYAAQNRTNLEIFYCSVALIFTIWDETQRWTVVLVLILQSFLHLDPVVWYSRLLEEDNNQSFKMYHQQNFQDGKWLHILQLFNLNAKNSSSFHF